MLISSLMFGSTADKSVAVLQVNFDLRPVQQKLEHNLHKAAITVIKDDLCPVAVV